MTRVQAKNFILIAFFLLPMFAISQTISGIVKAKNGDLLPYVKVNEYRATNKAITDKGGSFSLRLSILPTKVVFKSIGYNDVIITVSDTKSVLVTMEKSHIELQQKLSVGNVTKERNMIDSPVAITYIGLESIKASGKVSLDEVIAYSEASFNATNQAFSDVSTHYDVTDLRGLGSSRMLVLVNGKRKNLSAIAHISNTYGKSEVGTDLKSIPVSAIDHIEILREGASSIYGSDAVAGVINIILKEKTQGIVANINAGITTAGDGLETRADINGTFTNKKGAFVNYTFALSFQDYTNRAGEPGKDDLFGVSGNNTWIRENHDLGMTVGQPKMFTGNVYLNGVKPLKNGKGELYAVFGQEFRRGRSFLFAQAPYMNTDPNNRYHGRGYQPALTTAIFDNMDVVGIRYNTNGYKIDFNGTFGHNSVKLLVDESLNESMTSNDSPTSFDAGSYSFYNAMANIDVKKSFDKLNLDFKSEYKTEHFNIQQGVFDSWYTDGSVGFYGIEHSNVVDKNRSNFAAALNLDYDVNSDLLIGAGARYDNYSDVGGQVSYKANARYKIGDKGAVRASYGTSFRAPALQQMFLSYSQNNSSLLLNEEQRGTLGITDLEAETATNINIGFLVVPMKNLTVSLDYYKVDVDDRVILTSDFIDLTSVVHPYDQLLVDTESDTFRFFTNGINTATQGIDFSAKYDDIRLSSGVLSFTLMANWNDTEIVGDLKKPETLTNYDLFNRTDQSRIETGRPSVKGALGIHFKQDVFTASLNNNYFGGVTWNHAADSNKDQAFGAKLLTDIILNYQYSKMISFNIAAYNILNVYPDEIEANTDLDYGGRFVYSTQVNQFGVLGTQIRAGVNLKF